jgi:hypothetical protein
LKCAVFLELGVWCLKFPFKTAEAKCAPYLLGILFLLACAQARCYAGQMKTCSVWLLLSLFALSTPLLAQSAPGSGKVCAGAYYFDGWTGSWHLTPRLKEEFFDREPIWGWRDDSLPVVEQQIDCAADHGLAFFAFDWYWPEGANKQTPLNTGLELYLKAKNKQRLQFCLLVANHGGFRIGPADWDQVTDVWVRLFKEPTHLKVEGKPLLIFFSPKELRQAFGSSAAVKEAFEKLDAKARNAGLAGVCVAACATPGPVHHWNDLADLKAQGYSCFTGYNYAGHPVKGPDKIQPFARLMEGHQEIWDRFATNTPLPYMPAVTTGWDKRPWEDPANTNTHAAYYPDRTPVQVAEFVRRAIRWMDEHPDKTTKERIFLLYAWNENGEGGYLTPTKSQGEVYLKKVGEAIKAAEK